MFDAIAEFGTTILDKLFPDKGEAEKAKLKLLELQQQGELKELESRMSIMLAEAKSSDPWTSRARPAFLYVVYALILAAIPYGVLAAFLPDVAARVSGAMSAWWAAIPTEFWATFGIGYTGYTVARSKWDKDLTRGGKS